MEIYISGFYPSDDKYGMIEERSALGTRAPSGPKQPHYTPVLNVNLTQQPEHRHFTMFNFLITRLESIVT